MKWLLISIVIRAIETLTGDQVIITDITVHVDQTTGAIDPSKYAT